MARPGPKRRQRQRAAREILVRLCALRNQPLDQLYRDVLSGDLVVTPAVKRELERLIAEQGKNGKRRPGTDRNGCY